MLISIMKVVTRDKNFRRQQQNAKIKEYFYGSPKNEMNPGSMPVSFNDVAVRRVGEGKYLSHWHAPHILNVGNLAPSSALPIGMERKVQETRIVKVEPGDVIPFILAVLCIFNYDKTTKPLKLFFRI